MLYTTQQQEPELIIRILIIMVIRRGRRSEGKDTEIYYLIQEL